METFLLGIKALFRVWGDSAFAREIKALLEGKQPAVGAPAAVTEVPAKRTSARSEALTLLSLLQREARLIDFVKEPIAAYTDAQIGAAVRTVHKDCGAVFDRLFAIEPLRSESEGADINVPAGYDPAQLRLVGSIPASGPFRGTLQHAGWRAGRCEIPEWNGREESSLIVAPCEVEVK